MIEQNITLVIGDNASGKTRYLKNKIEEARKNNFRIVTNIPGYESEYPIDKEKLALIKETNNRLVERIVDKVDINTSIDAYIDNILRLLYSRGDRLFIEDIDIKLTPQNIIDISTAIADIRHTWNQIYITGRNLGLTRMFVDTETFNYTETYTPNIIHIDENMIEHQVTEDEECDYFD
jgi:hypothetical protein